MTKKHILNYLLCSALSVMSYTAKSDDGKELVLGNYRGWIFSDGSGLIGSAEDVKKFNDTWNFQIKTDEMTDKKTITVKRYAYKNTEDFGKIKLTASIYLWLNLNNKNSESLCVAGHDYPGMVAVIRIDKNKPIKTNENGCITLNSDLNNQMKNGNSITIRGHHWPYKGAETFNISLSGYTKMAYFLRNKRAN